MIRSSEHSLKYTNKGKLKNINIFISEYRLLLKNIIDDIWCGNFRDFNPANNKIDIPSYLPNDYLKTFDSWFTARMKQCVGKQACAMLRATTAKRKKQYWKLAELQKKGLSTKYLQRAIDTKPLVKPHTKNANPELDPRFIDIQEGNSFDLFVRIKTIGNNLTLNIPIKHTKSSLSWMCAGNMKNSIRVTPKSLILIYEVADKKASGNKVVGCDQGVLTTATLSDGQKTTTNSHGHDLKSIQEILARRVKGSKGFRRAQEHRKNYINWSLNQLDWKNIKEVRLEKIKQLRHSKRSSRFLSHWTYTLIKDKLVMLGETEGFRIIEQPNEFRSQRCSSCGFVRKSSRKGKTFKCASCDFKADADENAATNLEIDLFEIPYWVRQQHLNQAGFYWKHDGLYDVGHEIIVRDTI